MANFEQAGVELVVLNLSGFQGNLTIASQSVSSFGDATRATSGRVGGASQAMIGALRQVGVIAVDAMVAAGKAIGSFVADSIGAAGDFEAGMNQFSAVAGGALDEAGLKTKDFRDLFITLGKELPVSTAEVQQAATEMIKGGIDPATLAAGGLKQNIQFAAAAMGGDLVQAATVSAKILGGWAEQGATADERARLLTQATDLLTKAANASTVDVRELSLGLFNVQGTAKAAGLSLSETTTALAELSPRFASSAEAGNSLKNFLVRLQPTTNPAASAMQALGLYTEETGSKFFDAEGKFVGVAKASQLLQEATAGLTDAQRIQMLQTIFGNDAMNTASALAELGAKGFDDMSASMEKANGVQANAQTMQQGYNTSLENFKGSIEALQITIGSALLPILTDLFNNVLAPAVNTLTTLAGALSGDQDAFNQLSPAAQAVAIILQQLWADMQNGVAFISGLIASFQSINTESGTLGGVLGQLSGVWQTMQQVVTAVMDAYVAIAKAVFPIVSQFIADNGDEILATVKEIWDTIILIVDTALKLYNAIVPPILNAIAQFISDNGAAIGAIVQNAWDVIKSVIDIALALIQGIIKTALQLINGDFTGAWATLQAMNERVWNDIKTIIGAVWDTIKILLTAAWNDIKTKAEMAWSGIKGSIQSAIDGLVSIIEDLPSQVAGVGEAVVQAIWDGIASKWSELVDWFNSKLQDLKDQLPFSEPKDSSSPLYGLAKSGAAIVRNLSMGVAAASAIPVPAVAIAGGGMVAPPASPAQQAAQNNSYSYSQTGNTYNYSPTYAGAPKAPLTSFLTMKAFAL